MLFSKYAQHLHTDPHRRRRVTAVTILAILVCQSLEFLHHDGYDFSSLCSPVLTSHDCGDKEIHIPLDKVQRCAVCAQSAQRLSTAPVSFLLPPVPAVFQPLVSGFPFKPVSTDFISTGKRGPPLV